MNLQTGVSLETRATSVRYEVLAWTSHELDITPRLLLACC